MSARTPPDSEREAADAHDQHAAEIERDDDVERSYRERPAEHGGERSATATARSTRMASPRAGRTVALGLDRVPPAQVLRRLAHPDHPRRHAGDDRVRGTSLVTTELAPMIALSPTRHAAQDLRAVADPDVVADATSRL